MERLIFLCMMILSILTGHAQLLREIRTVTYPLVETNDSTLNSTIQEALAAFLRTSGFGEDYSCSIDSIPVWWNDIIIVLPDSIPSSDQFIATIHTDFYPFTFISDDDISASKEYYGTYYIKYKGRRYRAFVSGGVAKDFYCRKRDESYTFEYELLLIVGENLKISMKYDKGVWSVIPGSLEWY